MSYIMMSHIIRSAAAIILITFFNITYTSAETIAPRTKNIRNSETTTALNSETTTARDYEKRTARDSEITTARNSEITTARNSETTTARDSEITTARDSKTTTARDSETTTASGQNDTLEQKKRVIPFGYDGGMMLHTGYLTGTIKEIGHKASRMPFGIGGAIKFHIGKHFRIGSEGYVSTMKQLNNGSTIKFGWGGLLADFRFHVGKLMPYAGVTIGGGSRTCTLMFEGDKHDWEKEENVIFNKKPFFAVAPFVGTDFIITRRFHLTVKLDYLFAINKAELLMPTGPKLYFGFLMYH